MCRCMAASPSSLQAAVGSETGYLRLVECSQQTLTVQHRTRISLEPLQDVVFSPDGCFVAAASSCR